jgi:hypothetical protein
LSANAILPSDRKTPPVIAAFLFDRGTANWCFISVRVSRRIPLTYNTISDRLSRVDMNLEFNENAVEIPNLAKPLGFIQTKVSPCYVFTTTERIKQAPLYFSLVFFF